MQYFQAAILAAVASAVKTRDDFGGFMSDDGAFDYGSYMANFGPKYSGEESGAGSTDHYHYGEHGHAVEYGTHHDDRHDYHDEHYYDSHDDHHEYVDEHYEEEESYHTEESDHHEHHDVHHDYDDHHYEVPEPVHYDDHHEEHDDHYYGDVPTGDFWHQVDDFNEWHEIWDQDTYEYRLEQEAQLMVALEALREDLVDLDHDIDDLDSCISHNDSCISENDDGIAHNDHGISDNDHEISDQESRVKRLQRDCRHCQEDLDYDRDFLVLHCQQFAFAKDMVGACADILTCRGTDLAYRADVFLNAHHDDHHHDDHHH